MTLSSTVVRQLMRQMRSDVSELFLEAPSSSSRTNSWLSHILRENGPRATGLPSVLVVTPTKETATDIITKIHLIRTSSACVVGAVGGILKEGNVLELRRGCDYLVGTPGRLSWLLNEGHADLRDLNVLVLDEANTLLSSEFVVEILKKYVPVSARRILCSSTPLDRWYDDVINDLVVRPGKTLEVIRAVRPVAADSVLISPIVNHFYVRVNPNEEIKQIRYIIDSHREGCLDRGAPFKAIIIPRSSTECALTQNNSALKGYAFVSADMAPALQAQQRANYGSSKNAVLVCPSPTLNDWKHVSLVIVCGLPKTSETYLSNFVHCPASKFSIKSVVVIRNTEYEKFKRNIIEKVGTHGVHFGTIPLPSADALSVQFAQQLVNAVMSNTLTQFNVSPRLMITCKELLHLHGPQLLVGLLEITERRHAILEKTSLLSGLTGYTPVLLFDPFMKKLKTHDACQRLVKNCLRKVSKEDASNIGRIVLSEKGFVVDIPSHIADDLVRSQSLRNLKAIVISEMPRLIDDTKMFVLKQVAKDRKLLTHRHSRARLGRSKPR